MLGSLLPEVQMLFLYRSFFYSNTFSLPWLSFSSPASSSSELYTYICLYIERANLWIVTLFIHYCPQRRIQSRRVVVMIHFYILHQCREQGTLERVTTTKILAKGCWWGTIDYCMSCTWSITKPITFTALLKKLFGIITLENVCLKIKLIIKILIISVYYWFLINCLYTNNS